MFRASVSHIIRVRKSHGVYGAILLAAKVYKLHPRPYFQRFQLPSATQHVTCGFAAAPFSAGLIQWPIPLTGSAF
jgi:ABC-type transporter Mla maintaining outer membrane lipid asymmetry permease subunit MlaE